MGDGGVTQIPTQSISPTIGNLMTYYKRTSGSTGGFAVSKPLTPSLSPKAAPAPAWPAYVALGFIARTSDGQLLRLNAISGQTTSITYRRRRQVPAHA